jgi:hypothetical protein
MLLQRSVTDCNHDPPTVYWADVDPSPWRPSRAAKLAAIGAIAIVVVISGYVLMGFVAPKYPVALTITPSVSGRTLVIDGQTDLPDGAKITCELWPELEIDGCTRGTIHRPRLAAPSHPRYPRCCAVR